jgi:hypothetical protein
MIAQFEHASGPPASGDVLRRSPPGSGSPRMRAACWTPGGMLVGEDVTIQIDISAIRK